MSHSYWNADSDLDWSEPNMPDERLVSQCDCCGESTKPDSRGPGRGGAWMSTPCPKCRGVEADEGRRPRGDSESSIRSTTNDRRAIPRPLGRD